VSDGLEFGASGTWEIKHLPWVRQGRMCHISFLGAEESCGGWDLIVREMERIVLLLLGIGPEEPHKCAPYRFTENDRGGWRSRLICAKLGTQTGNWAKCLLFSIKREAKHLEVEQCCTRKKVGHNRRCSPTASYWVRVLLLRNELCYGGQEGRLIKGELHRLQMG